MKIMVAGLGLIGGSAAKALRRAGYIADGWDRDNVVQSAVKEGVIGAKAENFEEYDIVFVALPPDATVEFICKNKFSQGAIVADFCGVKHEPEEKICAIKRNFRYVGCHPMAGKEVSGFCNSDENLFDGASMIIVRAKDTDAAAVETLEHLYREMGFTEIVYCDSEYHDKKIAYTSQLAHIVSNAYVKSPTADGYTGFTGGSFQDMTRIAGVDENVWTRLYFLNRKNIADELSGLISRLKKYQQALENGREDELYDLLKEGRLRKEKLDKEGKN